MTDILIIGGGPAGVSAALYATRAGITTKIIYKDIGALLKAEKVDNFYGNPGISGHELVKTGLAQAEDMGAEIIQSEVIKIEHVTSNDHFCVETTNSIYTTRALLLATGASRAMPNIPRLADYEGKGVSQCAVCDAFFYRGKDVAVLGSGNYAISEAMVLLPLVNSLTLLTDGNEPKICIPPEITVRNENIRQILGEARLSGVELEPDGEMLPLSGLFVAQGVAGATELARKIGALTDGSATIADENMQTTIPGLWAAGDCTGGMKQIAKAVYEGAVAGLDMVRYCRDTISN